MKSLQLGGLTYTFATEHFCDIGQPSDFRQILCSSCVCVTRWLTHPAMRTQKGKKQRETYRADPRQGREARWTQAGEMPHWQQLALSTGGVGKAANCKLLRQTQLIGVQNLRDADKTVCVNPEELNLRRRWESAGIHQGGGLTPKLEEESRQPTSLRRSGDEVTMTSQSVSLILDGAVHHSRNLEDKKNEEGIILSWEGISRPSPKSRVRFKSGSGQLGSHGGTNGASGQPEERTCGTRTR